MLQEQGSDYRFLPYLLIENDVVIEVGYPLLDFTGYGVNDFIKRPVSYIFNVLLKSSVIYDELTTTGEHILILFTKAREPRQTLIAFNDIEDNSKRLIIFTEMPSSRIQDVAPHILDFWNDNCNIAAAIFCGNEYILLKANMLYLQQVKMLSGLDDDIVGCRVNDILKKIAKEEPKVFLSKQLTDCEEFRCSGIVLEGNKERYQYDIHLMQIKTTFDTNMCMMTISKISEMKDYKYLELFDLPEILDFMDVPVIRLTYPNYLIDYANKSARRLLLGTEESDLKKVQKTLQKVFTLVDFKNKRNIITMLKEAVIFKKPIKKEFTFFSGENKCNYMFYLFSQENIESEIFNISIAARKYSEVTNKEILSERDEFISFMAHELKTPINMVISAIQVMERLCNDQITDRIKYYLDIIKRNTTKQLRLVYNLLDIARADSGYMTVQKNNFDIVKLTKTIIESADFYVRRFGMNIRFNTLLMEKVIAIDDEKYERIFLNLMSNAIKYNKAEGTIFVNISKKRNWVCIEVRDEGIGIPKDKIDSIFECFEQVTGVRNEGAGIGLALVNKLVGLLNGVVEVSSEIQKGSSFKVFFPDEINENLVEDLTIKNLNQGSTNSVSLELSDIEIN